MGVREYAMLTLSILGQEGLSGYSDSLGRRRLKNLYLLLQF